MTRAWKAECRVASDAAVSRTGLQTVNTVAVVHNDRVLIKDDPDAARNGIYVVNEFGPWARAQDLANPVDFLFGVNVPVREPSPAIYQLATPNPILPDVTALEFVLPAGAVGGGGGGGFNPSDAPALNRTAYVGTLPSPALDDVNETGGPVAPFNTIAEALARFAGYTGGLVTILVDDATYAESLGFDIQDKSIVIRPLSGRRLRLVGSHSVTVGNNGHSLYVEGVGDASNANTFTVFDGGVPASSNAAYLAFHNCDNYTVALNGGATSAYNVFHSADSKPVNTFGPMRFACLAAYATGSFFCNGATLGNGTTGTFRGSGVEISDAVVRAGVTIQSSNTALSIDRSRFAGAATLEFTGSAGIATLDIASAESWVTSSGTKTLTNGTMKQLAVRGAAPLIGVQMGDSVDAPFYVDSTHARVELSNIGTTNVMGFIARTGTPGTLGSPVQYSPIVSIEGQAWDTDGTVSQTVHFGFQTRPVSATNVTGTMALMYGIGTAYAATGLSFTSDGKIYFGGLTPTASLDGSINLPYSGGIVAQRDSTVSANADTVFTVGTVAGDPNWASLGSANVKVRLANVVAIARATTSPTVAPSVGSLHWVDSATDNLESWSIGDTIFRYGAYVARFRSTSGIWTNLGASEIEVRVASSGSATSGYSTRVTGQFLTGSAADSTAGPGEARGGDNQGTGAAFVFKGGTGIVRGGDATGTGGGGTYVGGDAWLKPGTGATRTGNTMLGLSDPTSFNWQGMQRGFCVDMVAAKPTTNPPSQKVWMYVDPNDLRLRVQDESGDLSMTTPIGTPLADANATLVVSTAAIRHMPAATMTATRTLVLDDLDAVNLETIEIYRFDETATRDLVIQNHDATPIHTIPPGRWKAVFQFDGTDWAPLTLLRLP